MKLRANYNDNVLYQICHILSVKIKKNARTGDMENFIVEDKSEVN